MNSLKLQNKKNTLIKLINRELNSSFNKLSLLKKELYLAIIDTNFIQKNPPYYLYYPYLFSDFFNISEQKILDSLSIASFLYYKSIIFIDEIFDTSVTNDKFQPFLIANICQEETIKVLSSFFDKKHEFWELWNKRRFEYVKAYKLDKSTSKFSTFREFEELADYKSAFGKVTIDILHLLSNKTHTDVYKNLLKSHQLFYSGFQIIDDITDFKEDTENKQYNIAIQELSNLLSKNGDNIKNYSLTDQSKLVYTERIAENLYLKAINYLKQAIDIVSIHDPLEKTQWLYEIKLLHNSTLDNHQKIKKYVDDFYKP